MCNNVIHVIPLTQITEPAVSSDTYIGGKNVEEIAQEIDVGGVAGIWQMFAIHCVTWKNPG